MVFRMETPDSYNYSAGTGTRRRRTCCGSMQQCGSTNVNLTMKVLKTYGRLIRPNSYNFSGLSAAKIEWFKDLLELTNYTFGDLQEHFQSQFTGKRIKTVFNSE